MDSRVTEAYQAFGLDTEERPQFKLVEGEWPTAELLCGIAGIAVHIDIHNYGDWPESAFIRTWGTDPEAVGAVWFRVKAAWPELQKAIWEGKTRGT